MFRKKFLALVVSFSVIILIAGSCKKDAKNYKGKVVLTYVEWSSEVASTNLVKAVIEEKLNYKVEITPVSVGAMWIAIGSGDADGMVAAWLPTTQGHYLDKVKDKVENLGANLKGTKLGLVVPDYVTINSIAELNANADKFDGKIIGIDPGAGHMLKTEKVFKDYGLSKFKLMEGSGATMTAALADAIKNKKWVVVTGWTPHWKFAKWKLKYLKDPKKIYGGEEYIGTIVRKGLAKDAPEVYNFLKKFKWSPDEIAALMILNQKDGADPYENAKKWIKDNSDRVDSWIK